MKERKKERQEKRRSKGLASFRRLMMSDAEIVL